MAFKRSWVRLPSAPPTFSPWENTLGGQIPPSFNKMRSPLSPATFRKVKIPATAKSPEALAQGEALAPGLRSRRGCFGGVGKGDSHEVRLFAAQFGRPHSTLHRCHRRS